jgi:hypothetical protein
MDIYLFCLSLGFLGLAAMAFLGHMHTHAGVRGHGHAGGHASGHGNSTHGHARIGRTKNSAGWQHWISPRLLFSLLFAFGATGVLLRNLLPALLVLALALVAAWFFERWLVQPIWRLLFGFASNPMRTLESAVLEEAEAVTNFDQRGQGLVALQLDGQVIQLLASLAPNEQRSATRVRAGDRLSIAAVDVKRNSCTVTRLPVPTTSTARSHL